jgi:hypothetical protein
MATQIVVSLSDSVSIDALHAAYLAYLEAHPDVDMCFSRYLGFLVVVGSDAEFESLTLDSFGG